MIIEREVEIARPPQVLFDYTLRETVTVDAIDGGARMATSDVLLPTSLVGRIMVVISGGIVRRDLQARSARLKALLEGDEPSNDRPAA